MVKICLKHSLPIIRTSIIDNEKLGQCKKCIKEKLWLGI